MAMKPTEAPAGYSGDPALRPTSPPPPRKCHGNGGPAFPVNPEAHNRGDAECQVLSGMSLRDWFAGQALAGLGFMDTERTYDTDAHNCYQMADAMLKAREQV